MFCGQCGATVASGAQFCEECGTALGKVALKSAHWHLTQ